MSESPFDAVVGALPFQRLQSLVEFLAFEAYAALEDLGDVAGQAQMMLIAFQSFRRDLIAVVTVD